MNRWRKKPVVVEAVQWFPEEEFGYWDRYGKYQCRRVAKDIHGVEYTITEVGLQTKEGFMRIKPGDWIITGVEGERYACDQGIFAKTYEPVESSRSETQDGGWISVDDRLPEKGQRVLVCSDACAPAISEFNTWNEQPAGPTVGGYVECGPWFIDTMDDPTHWMPLPEVPR